MKFSKKCSDFLSRKLCIDIAEFEYELESKFGETSLIFDGLIEFMIDDDSLHAVSDLDVNSQLVEFDNFNDKCFKHLKSLASINEEVSDYAYEMMCYFQRYYCGGLAELFKYRQAENLGPRVYLKNRIMDDCIINKSLPSEIDVYRGMSVAEFDSYQYGMSWSLNEEIAKKFAFTTYYGQPRGVVVKARINRGMVLYYDPTDHEKEVVVGNNSINEVLLICR